MVEVKMIESSNGEKKVNVLMSGNPLKCVGDAICIVEGLYHTFKSAPDGEIFADLFCAALRDEVFKGDKELEKATRKAEDDFLRKFMDALTR